MTELLKKEWREMRLIPLIYGVLVALILTIMYVSWQWRVHYTDALERFTIDDVRGVLYFGCYLAGWLAGSNAIAPEVGRGTLRFLTTLPSGRQKIWWAKMLTGVIITVLSLLTVLCTYIVTSLFIFGPNALVGSFMKLGTDTYLIWILGAFCGYAISLATSTLVDSATIAAVLALVAGLIFFISQITFNSFLRSGWISPRDTVINTSCVLLLVICACLSASCMSFCRGGTLRTARRFGYALATIVSWYIIFTPILATYADRQFEQYRLQVEARSQSQAHQVKPLYQSTGDWSGETCFFALSKSVPQFQYSIEIHNAHPNTEPVSPVGTRDPGPNIHSWLTTDTRNGVGTTHLHFVYRLTGHEAEITPGHRLQRRESDFLHIDLLSKSGRKMGSVWLSPSVVK